MKIDRIRAFEVELGLALGPYESAKSRISSFVTTLVAVDTDDGVTGWGEVCPYGANYLPASQKTVIPILADLSPCLLGMDPRLLHEINAAMDRAVMHQFAVKTAIDYACWDVLGQSTGLPVHSLLGGRLTERLPLIASIPGGTEAMRAAVTHYSDRGYRHFSLHVSSPNPDHVPAYREVLSTFEPSQRIIIDANQSWTMPTAAEMARAFSDFKVMLEQPCASVAQCTALRARTTLPIILDESVTSLEDLVTAASLQALDSVALKIGRVGGLTKARAICDAADALGLPYWVKDVSGSEIATLATAHLAHSRSPKFMLGALSCVDMVDRRTGEANLVHEAGDMWIDRDRPGLGFAPDPVIERAPVAEFR
jgi:L-alanine-DL-glutamate epimerase-like enolase superfamily enzyme